MDILELKKILDSGNLEKNIYVFTGEEGFLKRQYAERIGNLFKGGNFDEFNTAFFEGTDINEKELIDFVETMPVMADKKFLHIKNSGVFKGGEGKLKAAVEYILGKCPDYCFVVINEDLVDGRSALLKKAKKSAVYVEFKYLNKRQLSAYVKKKFGAAGKDIPEDLCSYIAEYADEGLYSLNSEIDKLLAFIGDDGKITLEIIKNVMTRSVADRIFELTDAALAKDNDKAFKIISELKVLKEQPVKIIAIMGKHISTLLKISLLLSEGRKSDIAAAANVSPYFVNKYISQARAFSSKKLRGMAEGCKEADFFIKTGTKDDETALTLLMHKLLSL